MGYFEENSLHFMIKYTPASQLSFDQFKHPFEQQLDPSNRWVIMAQMVPWDSMVSIFRKPMSSTRGRGSVDLRHVLGALLVKHIEGLSDEDTIQYIQENIYAQYFIGLRGFTITPVFVPSLFVEIRKRLGPEGVMRLNDLLLEQAQQLKAIKHRKAPQKSVPASGKGPDDKNPPTSASRVAPPGEKDTNTSGASSDEASKETSVHRGTLKLDATVAPQHITFPTDTGLLHHARKISEDIIDTLWAHHKHLWVSKPRTYRRQADALYLSFQKNRKKSIRHIRKMRKAGLGYLKRNLGHIERMLDDHGSQACPPAMDHHQWHKLRVIHELYRQQTWMYRHRSQRIDDRIVSLAQPWIRPIQRGKKHRKVEFGAKLNISETNGFCRLDQWDYSNFNESNFLVEQIEAYQCLYGYYPASVLVDKIYLTHKNRNYLSANGIEHYGAPLGRPPLMSTTEKRERKKKQSKRSEIEGRFGVMKEKYGLAKIKMKRPDTTIVCIGAILLAYNLIRLAKASLNLILCCLTQRIKALDEIIIQMIESYITKLSTKWQQIMIYHSRPAVGGANF